MMSPVLGNLPINAIVFGTRGSASRTLDSLFPRRAEDLATGRPSYWRTGLAATWAGLCQCVVATPVELAKCRMQVQANPVKMHLPGSTPGAAAAAAAVPMASCGAAAAAPAPVYSGTIDCARQIYRSGGIRGLYAGWWVTVWRDAPAYAAWFVAYDAVRVLLTPPDELATGAPTSTRTALLAGSVAGIATWVSTYPFDVVKSVIQTAPHGTPPAQLRIVAVARAKYGEHGARFFFRGLAPTLLRAVPVSAVTFYVYERVLDLFGRQ
jgi:solute carrier family 25 carnitine/acylcarnitine transporter 20/29